MTKQHSRNKLNWLPIWSLKLLINIWPPFLGAGIKVTKISENFRHVEVVMKSHWYNKNYIGSHYGGSMFSMTDAFYMLMLIKNLGRQYIVWDKAAKIDFKKVARGKLSATFTFSEDELQGVRQHTDQNGKYIFDKKVDIFDAENNVVATVIKTLYVRRKELKKDIATISRTQN